MAGWLLYLHVCRRQGLPQKPGARPKLVTMSHLLPKGFLLLVSYIMGINNIPPVLCLMYRLLLSKLQGFYKYIIAESCCSISLIFDFLEKGPIFHFWTAYAVLAEVFLIHIYFLIKISFLKIADQLDVKFFSKLPILSYFYMTPAQKSDIIHVRFKYWDTLRPLK